MNREHTAGAAGERERRPRRRVDRYAPRVPTAVVAVGLLMVAVVVGEWGVWYDFRLVAESLTVLSLGGGPALGVTYGGYWLRRSRLSVDHYPRVGAWCFGGLFAFLAANLLVMANFPASTFTDNFGWARGAAVWGAAGGLVIGLVEARAVERARVAERAAMRAEHVETQRKMLVYLNSVLRHEVLNAANVVEGYADLLVEDHEHDDVARDRLRRIRHQSQRMAEVIRDVQVLIEATEGTEECDVVDLGDVLTDAVADLRTTYEGVEVDLSVPDDAFVAADDLLPRVFSNLLINAVEHNDSDVPRVSVTAETTSDWVTVRVADNGPGVSEADRATLFQRTARGTSHGLGLYLVRTLARRYGGEAELTETGPDGSVFAVQLPRAADPSAGERDRDRERSSAPWTESDAFAPSMESESA